METCSQVFSVEKQKYGVIKLRSMISEAGSWLFFGFIRGELG
jgi:hypothetical protein